ncbi:mannose-1-phosphate guanylyltransferase [Brachybacterium alimentarium]|uniref:mannose-1-phosphate guanylyltransferase n=1 Tax=Brachybacterium alimentarium TaxID=47845 RepID=UPI003FD54036
MPQAPFVPVIPAGGAGTRLWPLSRRDRPKFLLDLTGSGASLLQQTVARLAPLADRAPIVVTGVPHVAAVREQVGSDVQILAEPSPRNSMPAIALAAALVERDSPDAVIGSFAADHLIGDHASFARAVTAARHAAELGHLVTIGIRPTHAATGFGYIERVVERHLERDGEKTSADGGAASGTAAAAGPTGTAAATETAAATGMAAATESAATADDAAEGELRALGAAPVSRFVEKPDRDRAEAFLASGTFSWNAGIFVVRARVLLDELAEQIPGIAHGARAIAAAHGTQEYSSVLAEIWPRLTSIAIDHALAEPLAAAGKVAMVPGDFDWDDVGDFAAVARQLREHRGSIGAGSAGSGRSDGSVGADGPVGSDGSDVQVLGAATVDALSSTATVYGSTDRHIALVGLQGISIVDTEDALLVLADEQAQTLARIVARLDENGHGHLR